MTCPRCQHENPAAVKFCGECGARLDIACAACRAPNPPGNKFCHECGAPMAPKPVASGLTAPESYTPKHLAEKILTSKAALEGERKQITVLFADLKGSMELLADRDPEEARKLLDPVLQHMMEAVHRYEGTVNQVMGDGIMALFGAPLAHEDHAVRACYAALRMQDSVNRYAEGVRREHGVTIRIRVGLNSGEVVVRTISSDLHMDYTAVGQTTHLAARMEQLADPGSILLTPSTLMLAEGFVQASSLGAMAVKGLATRVEVYELNGVSLVRSRLQAAATRGLSRFVGRDAELEHLRWALEQAREGHGQVTAFVGEPGVGKSRLVFELTHSHRVEGWLVLQSGSVSYGKATTYLPVIDLLRSYFRISARDTPRDIREKVTGRILTLDESLKPTLPALLALLDVSVDDPQWKGLDPPGRRQQTLDAVRRLLLRETLVQPLLVVVEDLHWIDSESQAILDILVESVPTTRLLLLVNYRPEYCHAWGSKTFYAQHRLDTLPPESAGKLLEALLGSDPSLDLLKVLLATTTGGNPFFLEESVRMLIEAKALLGERGGYHRGQSVETVRVPATVQAILAARIDRLRPDDKRLLQAASVVGKDIPFALLEAIADLPGDDLRASVMRLQVAEFLYEAQLFPDLEYTFKHALTHEVTYGGLLQDRRRELHARIVDAIEILDQDRFPGQTERLAHHAFRGERWRQAAEYYRRAGTKAFERSGNREAAVSFEHSLIAVTRLPETPETLAEAIDLRFDIRNARTQTMLDFREVGEHLRAARAAAERLGDPRRIGRAEDYLSNYHYNRGELADSQALAEHALEIAVEVGDFGLAVAARFHLGVTCYLAGAYDRAVDLLGTNASILGAQGETRERFGLAVSPAILSRVWLAKSLAEQGAFSRAIDQAEEAVRMAKSSERILDVSYAYRATGAVYLFKGDLLHALPVLERGFELSKVDDLRGHSVFFATYLGHAYALADRLDEARPLVEQANEAAGGTVRLASSLRHLADVRRREGRRNEAVALAQKALATARDRGQRGEEGHALRTLGEAVVPDEPSAAGRWLRDALALAGDAGMRPLVAHCHLGLGKLYRRTGQHEQAREHLTTATTMYRDMGMTYWLEKAESESRR